MNVLEGIEENLLDLSETPGLIVTNGPSPLLGGQEHYHVYLFPFMVRNALALGNVSVQSEEVIYQFLIGRPWGVLALISTINSMWMHESRFGSFFSATSKYWSEFVDLGDRFTIGSNDGRDIWNTPTNLKYVLANMGVTLSELRTTDVPKHLSQFEQYFD